MQNNKNDLSRKLPALPRTQLPHDYSVQFGEQKRDQEIKAFPFFYGFVKSPYQVGTPDDSFGVNQTTGIYRVSAADAEGPDGLTIPSLGQLDIPVVMDNDSNFHLLYVKFGAFTVRDFTGTVQAGNTGTISQNAGNLEVTGKTIIFTSLPTGMTLINTTQPYFIVNANGTTFEVSATLGGTTIIFNTDIVGTITWTRLDATIGSREYLTYPYTYADGYPFNPLSAGVALVPDAARNARIPYWSELDVALYMTSSASRDIYGGFQREPIGGITQETLIPILDLQGMQDGIGMLNTAYQLTKSATVMIRVRSRSAFPLRVYGHLFGYKITI